MEDQIGIDFSSSGSVMNKTQLEEQRRRKGECLTCGQKCFQKKLFKMVPLTREGEVLDGRCLKCKPLDKSSSEMVLPAATRPATKEDLHRFSMIQSAMSNSTSQSNLNRTPSTAIEPSQLAPGKKRTSSLVLPKNAHVSPPLRTVSGIHVSNEAGSGTTAGLVTKKENYRQQQLESSKTTQEILKKREPSKVVREIVPPHEDHNQSMDPLQRTMLAGMAARRIAHNFRQKKSETSQMAHEIAPAEGESEQGMDSFQNYRRMQSESSLVSQNMMSPPVEYDQTLSSDSTMHDFIAGESAHSTRSSKWDDDDANLKPPATGTLDRGGQFRYENKTISLTNGENPHRVIAGSTFTIGSISSIEEEADNVNGNRQLSWKPKDKKLPENVTYEYNDDDDLSIDSETGSCRSRENNSTYSSMSGHLSSAQNSRFAALEERAVENLAASSNNYCNVISIMRELPSSAMVQQEGLKYISEMQLSDEEYSEIMDIGVLEDVRKAMATHADIPHLQCVGCRAIWNLSATTQNQIRLVEEGALDIILAAMKDFSAESDVQEKALSAISNLGAAMENQERILHSETLEQLIL